MRIMVLGADGYLGWPTCMYLSKQGHEVMAVDNYLKKSYEKDVGVKSLVETYPLEARCEIWKKHTGLKIEDKYLDVKKRLSFIYLVDVWKPDTIIHYAEQPSAPYSMSSHHSCLETFNNNINTTLSILWAIKNTDTHLIKLGTMGEYGTPNIDIEEGWIDIEHNGRSDTLPYPKQPGSFYHVSKVADSTMIEFACRTWGIKATDLNQGVVYGVDTDETILADGLHTSFHYDAVFGTVLNRFIAQAVVWSPLTVYGNGSQTRGFLNIKDTLQCVGLACENQPEAGHMRVMNQFTEEFSVVDLARMVSSISRSDISFLPNPRVEKENHYYNAKNTKLKDLGLKPHYLTDSVLRDMLLHVSEYKDNIDKTKLLPEVTWK